jgi:putative transcriptional regulator
MRSVAKSLLKGANEAIKFAAGRNKGIRLHKVEVSQQIDVKGIRLQLHLSRNEFSEKFGFSPRTLEKWEQGIRNPDTTARAYLTVIAHNPTAVNQALNNAANR